MPAKRSTNAKTLSKAHKEALAAGREDGWAVRRYLEALDANKPKRGRPRTTESIQESVAQLEHQLESATPLNRLRLVQRRADLLGELESLAGAADMEGLEEAFVGSAAAYGLRKGITYETWRKIGVGVDVLSQAGITR